MKNVIYNELKLCGFHVDVHCADPDADKKAQEICPFRKIEDSFKKIIVTRDIVPAAYDENGVLTVNIDDFLLNRDCLES